MIGMKKLGLTWPMGWASRVPIMATAITGASSAGEAGHAGVALVEAAVGRAGALGVDAEQAVALEHLARPSRGPAATPIRPPA